MNAIHSDGKAVRPAAVAAVAGTARRPQKMLNVLALAIGAILLVLSAACTTATAGKAVPEKFTADTPLPGTRDTATVGAEGACTHVDAPMLDVPTASDSEPRMRIPQPPGWERTDELNDVEEGIRFGMVSTELVADDPPQNVVLVTLEALPDIDAQTIFDQTRADLEEILDEQNVPADFTTTAGTVCGLPAETLTYAGAAALDARPVTILSVVAKAGGDTYQAAVVQTIEPGNPTYERGAETILMGFEVLPPTASQV